MGDSSSETILPRATLPLPCRNLCGAKSWWLLFYLPELVTPPLHAVGLGWMCYFPDLCGSRGHIILGGGQAGIILSRAAGMDVDFILVALQGPALPTPEPSARGHGHVSSINRAISPSLPSCSHPLVACKISSCLPLAVWFFIFFLQSHNRQIDAVLKIPQIGCITSLVLLDTRRLYVSAQL